MTFRKKGVLALLGIKFSILGDIFDKDTRSSLCTSLDLCLVIILVSVENAFSHKYVVAKGINFLTAF